MADQVQLRGGTTVQHSTFTGALRECTVDTDKKVLVVHDGATPGGTPMLRQDLGNLPAAQVQTSKLAFDAGSFSLKNRTINGAMKIDQRNDGASQTFTAAAALAYCVDRFFGYCTGANITGQQITLANGQNRYRFTGAASNTGVGFGHRYEAVNTMDMAGGNAKFQVKLSSSSLTSITWTAYYANTKDTFGSLASPTKTQIATGTFTINATEATYAADIAVPAAATTGIEIVLTGGALLGSQTLTIGDWQFEAGNTASAFESTRPYTFELALCQRYAYRLKSDVPGYVGSTPTGAVGATSASGTIAYRCTRQHPVEMRAAPTVTFSGLQAWNGAQQFNVSSVNNNNSTRFVRSVDWNVSGTFSATSVCIEFMADTGWVQFEAEL